MVSIYDHYNYQKEHYEKNKDKLKEYFSLLVKFKNSNYDERVALMKEKWGDVKENKTIKYTDFCSVEIIIDKDNKFKYNFECKLIDFKTLYEVCPDVAQDMMEQMKDDIEKYQKEYEEQMKSNKEMDENLKSICDYNRFSINKTTGEEKQKTNKEEEKDNDK